ncbi:fibrinogen C domain-containing protein 1-like [Pollicipes pollicipes]|uniref:fibrinogen C domain-containing protein 1-like n=1 Tax=Pollicipes pollicipes TaxID=41117 RepID=UPI001884FF41|nr:fibrinogen C domain-containing protein 1-like [Pollicipes pollicipes]
MSLTKLADSAELTMQLIDGQYELAAQSAGLSDRLAAVQARLSAQDVEFEAALLDVHTELTAQHALGELSERLDGRSSELTARLVDVESELTTQVDSLLTVLLSRNAEPVPAYCDQDADGGGWIVVHRRAAAAPALNVSRGWEAYKWGFGQLDGNFWWGNERLWAATALLDRRYELRVDLRDADGGTRHALYRRFAVSSEPDGYRLTVADYSGDAGDALGRLSGRRFWAGGRGRGGRPGGRPGGCAEEAAAGWWRAECAGSGDEAHDEKGAVSKRSDGGVWTAWTDASLKSVEMKIRSVGASS